MRSSSVNESGALESFSSKDSAPISDRPSSGITRWLVLETFLSSPAKAPAGRFVSSSSEVMVGLEVSKITCTARRGR